MVYSNIPFDTSKIKKKKKKKKYVYKVVDMNFLIYFQGFIPAFVRLGPHTILTFMFLEQIRMNFGDDPVTR